ncbi:hypothetical protein Tco_0813211 [Tanacetum coccineum]
MTSTRQTMTQKALEELLSQRVADALETYDANRNNGDDSRSHNSGSGGRRTVHTTRGCTYKEFLNCQPLNFKRTEGANHGNQAGSGEARGRCMPWEEENPTSPLSTLKMKLIRNERFSPLA